MDTRTYPSRIDTWLIVLVAGAIGYCLLQAALLLPRSPAEALFVVGVAAFVAVLLWAVGWPCVYTLEDDALAIRSGLMRFRIPYGDIASIAPSSNPLSAPALSLKRVKIVHTRGFALISPRDREGFIAALHTRVAAAQAAAVAPLGNLTSNH